MLEETAYERLYRSLQEEMRGRWWCKPKDLGLPYFELWVIFLTNYTIFPVSCAYTPSHLLHKVKLETTRKFGRWLVQRWRLCTFVPCFSNTCWLSLQPPEERALSGVSSKLLQEEAPVWFLFDASIYCGVSFSEGQLVVKVNSFIHTYKNQVERLALLNYIPMIRCVTSVTCSLGSINR